MGLALPRREAVRRIAIDGDDILDRAADEHRSAAFAYLAWPLALAERVAPRAEASLWYRFHLRQAFWFGIAWGAAAFAALAWPLVFALVVGAVGPVLWIYSFASALDLALFAIWLVLVIRYSRRARNGDLFEIGPLRRLTGSGTKTP